LAIVVGWIYWDQSRSSVELNIHGRVTFYRGGFFHRDKFELYRRGNSWYFLDGELPLPFECPYGNYVLRLDTDGRVFLVQMKKMTRFELRVVEGEWSYDAGGHWVDISDLGDVE